MRGLNTLYQKELKWNVIKGKENIPVNIFEKWVKKRKKSGNGKSWEKIEDDLKKGDIHEYGREKDYDG